MSMFVHLTPAKNARSIRRAGITTPWLSGRTEGPPWGVFALPVTPNFVATHQWLRELRRWGQRTFLAVYFRLPDDEPIWFGPYHGPLEEMTAAQAVAAMMAVDPGLGYQVVVPRPVAPREIHAIRSLRQVLGWRYRPGAHGHLPCTCPFCTRGKYGGRKLRQRLDDG